MEDEITIHSYDWQVKSDHENSNSVIHCWGLNRDSEPNLLRFHNFDAFCYVELPQFLNNSYIRWKGFRERIVYDAICYKLEEDRPHKYMYVEKEKLYFYKGKNKKYPMLLLCFHSVESMQKCKNKLKYPFKVRGIKGDNDETMVSLKVWETHIPLERKMLTLKNCKYSQWFNVKGIKVKDEDKISTLENEYVVDWKTLKPLSEEETVSWITHPKILSFDLETYSDRHNSMPDSLCSKHVIYLVSAVFQKFMEPETRKKDIILFGDCSETELANVIKVKTEMELIETFQDLILKYDPDIVIGYNIFGYDYPYLENRLKRRLKDWKPLGRLIGEKSEISSVSWSSSAYKNQDFNILEMPGRISIDVLPVVRRDFKLPLYKLDFVAKHFLNRGKFDVSAKQMFEAFELQKYLNENCDINEIPDNFFKMWKKNLSGKKLEIDERNKIILEKWKEQHKEYALDEMRKVVDYCVVDSDLVVDLFDKINIWIGLIQMSNIMGITPIQIFTRGTGVRMISQVYDEAFKSNIVMDEVDLPKMSFEGGYVPIPLTGIHHNIPILDFKSLYPSIIISHNLDHTTLVPKHLESSIPDEECHVIEWDDEIEEDSDSDSDSEEDVSPKKKVKKKKIIHHRYKFIKDKIGIMPRLLTRLIAERNKVRARQKTVPKGSLEWNVLEQTQLGIKCSSNAFFGACGSNFGKVRCPAIAAAITGKARESTKKMNAYLENKGYTIVYGDSVTGDTPLVLRKTLENGEKDIFIRTISQIKTGMLLWKKEHGKEYCVNFGNIEVWSDKGFTKIKHVMRHKTKKRIFRITTHTGVVKVTEDHSLLDLDAKEIRPNEVKLKDKLLTKEMPELSKEGLEIEEAWVWGIFYGDGSCGVYESCQKSSWAINNLNLDFLQNAKIILEKRYPQFEFKILDTVKSSGVYKLIPVGKGIKNFVEEWRNLFYEPKTKYKKIPDILWKSSEKTRINFYNGYYSADGDKDENGYNRFDNKGQIGSAGLFLLSKSLGYKVSCNTRKDKQDIYRLTLTKNSQRKHPGEIKKIEDLGFIDEYVYDLETENHHFSAGVGELVVHNTDSTMVDVGVKNPKDAWAIGKKLAVELSSLYLKPMELELEAIFYTMLSIKKKMYLCIMMDDEGNPIEDPEKMKIRGVTLARRDNCQFQRDFYKETVWKVMHEEPFLETFNYIVDMCIKLASHSARWQDLVMIKGLGSHYKNKNFMMKIFADEMEKAGNPMVAGDRIPYLVVKTKEEKMGMKMRTQELFLERVKAGTPEHIDYLLYLEKTIRNGIEKQLFQIGYKKELEELNQKYKQMDQDKFFQALEDKLNVGNLGQIRLEGYRKKRRELNNDDETIEWLITDANLSKIAKPLYNYHIKRRKGRGRRISSRIDKEPILMMVRLMKIKEEVMESVRNYVPKKKIIKIIKLKIKR